MQQRTRRLAMLLGGSLLATVGFLAACSTDNGTTPLPGTGGDSGRDTKKDGSDTKGDDDDDDTTPGDGGTGADCGNAPKLRSNDKGSYCAFFVRDAAAGDAGAGGNRNCSHDETCCNPGKGSDGNFPSSFCASTPRDTKGGNNGQTACGAQATANGSTWNAAGSTWECADKNSCGAGETCCMFTWADGGPNDKVNIGKSLDKDIPAACGALQAFKQGGTRCATSCASDEIQLCSLSDDSCTGNQKCTPFSGQFRDLGACRQ